MSIEAKNAPPNERAADHLATALIFFVVQTFTGTLGKVIEQSPTLQESTQTEELIGFVSSIPGFITLGGWILAIGFGGPLGVFGFPLGVYGGRLFVPPDPSPMGGIIFAFLGGSMTWIGFKTGGWRPFL